MIGHQCVLIAAGAGLSAAAGLDYTDQKLFKRLFPVMWTYGFRCLYHFIGYHSKYCPDGVTPWSNELKWGYLAKQMILARFSWPKSEVYGQIYRITERKAGNWFVISTNADGMFVQNDFDPDRIYNPQGDYCRLQCLKPCRSDAVWPGREIYEAITKSTDECTQRCTSDVVPVCPHCGGPSFMNVRGGGWFVEDAANHGPSFHQWLQAAEGKKMVVLEVGVGFNTPSVLRWPMEQLVSGIVSVVYS